MQDHMYLFPAVTTCDTLINSQTGVHSPVIHTSRVVHSIIGSSESWYTAELKLSTYRLAYLCNLWHNFNIVMRLIVFVESLVVEEWLLLGLAIWCVFNSSHWVASCCFLL